MELNKQVSESGKGGVAMLFGIVGLVMAGAALVLGVFDRQKAATEIQRLNTQIQRLEQDGAGGRLGELHQHVRSLASNHLVLSERAITAQQFSNMVNELTYMRVNLDPVLDRLDRLGQGTNALIDVRMQAEKLARIQARLAALSAKPVPYTLEELALLQIDKSPLRQRDLEQLAGLSREAQRAYGAGRHADAEALYLKLLAITPHDHLTLANLGTVQMELGKLDEAERNLEAALYIHADDAKTVALIGLAKLRQQKLSDALLYLSRAAAMAPDNAETHNYIGIVLSQQGQRAAAETAFRKALKLAPDYPVAHFNLAVYYITGKPPASGMAKWHYDKAVMAGHPKNAKVEQLLASAR